jgi:hypothetical protein
MLETLGSIPSTTRKQKGKNTNIFEFINVIAYAKSPDFKLTKEIGNKRSSDAEVVNKAKQA